MPASLIVAIWTPTWPIEDGYSGKRAEIDLGNLPEKASLQAYDGLTGKPVELDIEKKAGSRVLENFRIEDYPTLIKIQLNP